MTEQEQKENTTPPNINELGSSGPDFSGMGNLKLNDLEVTPAGPNLISETNAQE